MRSLARDFSSSRRAPPNAASKPYLSSACFSACVFMTSVWIAEPCVNGLMPMREPLAIDVDDAAPCRPPRPCASRNANMSRNFQVVSTCISGNGGLAG